MEVRFRIIVLERQADGSPRLLGPFAQGPPSGRFVYVTCWDRRAKVHLRDLPPSIIEQAATSGRIIETQIAGTGRDGGSACATVPLIGGWRIASS